MTQHFTRSTVSAADWTLDYSGDPVPCDFPGCVLDSFHEGDHRFVTAEENNARLAAAVTSYGVGTRSYNRSAEKRELERQREIATARYEAMPRREIEAPLLCRCPQREYPHELSIHFQLRSESFNPKLRLQWPWNLCLSLREEPSAERKTSS